MKSSNGAWFMAAVATAALATATAPVFAQDSYVDPWVMKNRAAGKAVWREGGRAVGRSVPWRRALQRRQRHPDMDASYWFGFAKLPKGAEFTVRGKFPHARYFQLAVYRRTPDGSPHAAPLNPGMPPPRARGSPPRPLPSARSAQQTAS